MGYKSGIIFIKNLKKKSYNYKFYRPIKYYMYIYTSNYNSFYICVKLKTKIITQCLNCKIFFSKKIYSSSHLKIFMRNYEVFHSKKNSFFNEKILNFLIVLKEEIFYNLPFLSKHYLKNCNKYKQKLYI